MGSKNKRLSVGGKYGFNRLGTSSWETCEVLWASTFVQAWNLAKLEGSDNLVQLD